MKKYLLYSAAAIALLSTSCTHDDVLPNGEDGLTTITVAIPSSMTTRYGNGEQATKLYVAIYPQYEEKAIYSNFPGSTVTAGMTVSDFSAPDENNIRTATITVPLVRNDTYAILCWAQDPSCNAYTFSESDQTITVNYANADGNMSNYDESRDAFFGKDTKFVADGSGTRINLTRPFAQINIGTADWENYLAAFGSEDIEFGMTIKGASDQINLYSGKIYATDSNPEVITVAGEKAKEYNTTNTTNNFPVANPQCAYLAMAYVLADQNLSVGLTGIDNYPEWPTIPAKMNFQTNIYGNLLTYSENITIVVDPNFGGVNDEPISQVSYVNGKIVCNKPILPPNVTEESIKNYGGVYIDETGTPQYFAATGVAMADAMQKAPVVYLAPNATITFNDSHVLDVPATGTTVYGNGATLQGEERDFDINNPIYAANSNVNIKIRDLNNFKIWGNPDCGCIFNIDIRNCALNGTGLTDELQMIVIPPNPSATKLNTANITMDNCHFQNIQEGCYVITPGITTITNSTFNNVGIGLNYAKKAAGKQLVVNVDNCTFTDCGVSSDDTSNSVYNYSAPIRIVDNTDTNKTTVNISGCKFTGTRSQYDVLLYDYREGKISYPVLYTITNSGDVTVGKKE